MIAVLVLQQYINHELPDVQARFRKDRGTRDQIANIHWIIKQAREFQKNICFYFIDYAKASDCLAGASPLSLDVGYLFVVGSNIFQSMVVQQRVVILAFSQEKMSVPPSTPPSSSTTSFCSLLPVSWSLLLLRNQYAGQEATVRIGHGTADWFQIRKGVHQGCILSPCLFNLYAEYIIRNARLDGAQARIKIARRNINNLRYADDTTLICC